VSSFDAAAFGLSEAEALLIDPQQRLLMEAYSQAVAAQSKMPASTGVYMGISAVDYNKLTTGLQLSPTPYSATGSLSLSVAAGRLSYSFGLKGPALAIETACSSSLVAVQAAMSGLQLAHSMAAVVGGVNVQLIPDTPANFQKAGM
jgi:acyl transferase domain-containing protein